MASDIENLLKISHWKTPRGTIRRCSLLLVGNERKIDDASMMVVPGETYRNTTQPLTDAAQIVKIGVSDFFEILRRKDGSFDVLSGTIEGDDAKDIAISETTGKGKLRWYAVDPPCEIAVGQELRLRLINVTGAAKPSLSGVLVEESFEQNAAARERAVTREP